MKISVVMAAYNEVEFTDEIIKRVLSATKYRRSEFR
jgi:glycosyltransferase involved in cell wall biosynthesis